MSKISEQPKCGISYRRLECRELIYWTTCIASHVLSACDAKNEDFDEKNMFFNVYNAPKYRSEYTSFNSRENGDEQVEQHDVADEDVDGEEGGRDVVVVEHVLRLGGVAVLERRVREERGAVAWAGRHVGNLDPVEGTESKVYSS